MTVARILTAILSMTATGQGIRKVDGLLFVSSDQKAVATVRKEYQDGEPWGDVVKRFPTDRYLVKEWGRRSMIVIDLKTGPLGQLLKQLNATKSIRDSVGSSCLLNASQLRQEDIEAMYMGNVIPPGSRVDGVLGFIAQTNVTVRNGNRTKTIQLMTDPDRVREIYAEMGSSPLKVQRPNRDTGNDPKDTSVLYDETTMPFLGIATHHYAEGFVEAGKIVGDLEIRAKRELEAVTADLLTKRLGYGGKRLPSDELPLEQLPDATQKELQKMFASSWKTLGFQDKSEAEEFLKGATAMKLSTDLGAYHCITPRDPVTGRPGAYGAFIFSRIPGAYFP